MKDIPLESIDFRTPMPIKHMAPIGFLPMTKEAACLWQFLICAFQAYDKVESQTTLEGEEDQRVDLMQVVDSVRHMYGDPDIEKVFNARLVAAAKREATRCALPWNSRIDSFIDSGGKNNRFLDRDADKVGGV
jgi:hypothetical protein